MFDATQDYGTVFMYSGIVFLLNAVVILLIPLLRKTRPSDKENNAENSSPMPVLKVEPISNGGNNKETLKIVTTFPKSFKNNAINFI